MNFLVDLAGHFLAVVALLAEVSTEEDQLLLVTEGQRAELIGHAPLGHHPARQLGRLADVVGGTGGDVAKGDLLGDPAAEHDRHVIVELAARNEVAVLGGKLHRPTQGHATRDDRHLVNRIGVGQRFRHQRVPDLVVGDHVLLGLGDHPRFALGACDHPGNRFLELELSDRLLVVASCQDGRFVDQVAQVRSTEPRRLSCEHLQVNGAIEGLVPGVHLEDGAAAADIGAVERHVAVETARSQEGGI